MSAPTRVRRWWTDEEDRILRCQAESQEVSQGGLKDWSLIATKLQGRTNKDCRKRWSKVCQDVNKGVWSSAEDKRLKVAIKEYGCSWIPVAQSVETRHADQCAKRWQHSLDPDIDHSEWTTEDDERLMDVVGLYGRNWKMIGQKEFPCRPATDLKNRYVIVNRRRQHTLESLETAPANANPTSSVASQGCSDTETCPFADDTKMSLEDLDLSFGVAGTHQSEESKSAHNLSDLYTPSEMDQCSALPPLPDFDDYGHFFPETPEDFLSQSPASAFSWDDPSMLMGTDWAPPETPYAAVGTVDPTTTRLSDSEPDFHTTLLLEDVQPDTLNSIMHTLFETKQKVSMRVFSTRDSVEVSSGRA